jgi:hypothetical protein
MAQKPLLAFIDSRTNQALRSAKIWHHNNDDKEKRVGSARRDVPTTTGCYIYAIIVDGVVRYIGKGRNGRMCSETLTFNLITGGGALARLIPPFARCERRRVARLRPERSAEPPDRFHLSVGLSTAVPRGNARGTSGMPLLPSTSTETRSHGTRTAIACRRVSGGGDATAGVHRGSARISPGKGNESVI